MFVKFWGFSFFSSIFSRLLCFFERWEIYLSPNQTNQGIAFELLKFVTNRKSTVYYKEKFLSLKRIKLQKGILYNFGTNKKLCMLCIVV